MANAPGFGGVIRTRRRQLDLTQEELARRINKSVPYIGLIETEKRHPSVKTIAQLAEALGLDPRELFFLGNPRAKLLISGRQELKETPWKAFCKDEALRKIHGITDAEMNALAAVTMLGQVRDSRDFLFILNTIRQALA